MLSVHSVLQHLWAPKKIVMAASILLVATWTMADSIAAEISEELLATYKPAQYTAPNGEKISYRLMGPKEIVQDQKKQ